MAGEIKYVNEASSQAQDAARKGGPRVSEHALRLPWRAPPPSLCLGKGLTMTAGCHSGRCQAHRQRA